MYYSNSLCQKQSFTDLLTYLLHTLSWKFQLQFPKKCLKWWIELLQICTASMIDKLLLQYFLSNFFTLFYAFLHRWSNVLHAIWCTRKWEFFHSLYIYQRSSSFWDAVNSSQENTELVLVKFWRISVIGCIPF